MTTNKDTGFNDPTGYGDPLNEFINGGNMLLSDNSDASSQTLGDREDLDSFNLDISNRNLTIQGITIKIEGAWSPNAIGN